MRFDNLHINERTTEACERVTTYYTEANQARGWYSFAVVCLVDSLRMNLDGSLRMSLVFWNWALTR